MPDAQRLGMLYMALGTPQELQQQIIDMTFERCCLNDPLPCSATMFTERGKSAKNRLLLIAQELARLAAQILTEHHAVQKLLPQLKASPAAQKDVREQLEFLLPKHFVTLTPYERLQHVPRYLKGIQLRIEKYRSNPSRDAQCMTQMQPLNQAYAKRRAERDEFAWMMQELRISLFAQELKTPVIVSVKRLEKMLVGK